MAEGKLIIELYEYKENLYDDPGSSAAPPAFEYIPCDLGACMKRDQQSTLREIIQKGFDDLPRQAQDLEKRQEVMRRIEEADLGRVRVAWYAPRGDADPYVELTNVVPVTMASADARYARDSRDEIILYGKYELSEGNQTTVLRDAQRLTLTYTCREDPDDADGGPDDAAFGAVRKTIQLNITYLQDA